MKRTQESNKTKHQSTTTATNGFIPNSLRFISSCVRTVSSNVRSAGASVSSSLSGDPDEHHRDQVLWASFDKLELGPSFIKRVLLLGYTNGFQVIDVGDASNFSELVSKRDDPVTFLQMQPIPATSEGCEGFRTSHPLLLVVANDETSSSGPIQNGRDGYVEPQMGNLLNSPTAVRFYSLKSHSYVHILRFRSTVYMVRCSSRLVAVSLAAQIYCFDALTLESKFSVLTYPVPHLDGPLVGVNIGYGPMAVGTRWLAYASHHPLSSNMGRLSPQSLSPSPGVSPSTSPGSGNLVARYALESSKQLAAGLMNLGDKGYKTLTKYYHDLVPDGSSPPMSSNSGWKAGRATAQSTETDTAGTVIIRDFVSEAVVSQFRAHTSPISALCFDPSGTLLVTASIHGNNINIFRLILRNGSGIQSNDWSYSHVHLYKLHRGMTSAVIQDISFSQYSQWIAIVSSKGTCHIFVLSPFGGETGLQIQNSHVDGLSLTPILTQPWWSASSVMLNEQPFTSPPAPITLSVVSRVRLGNSGWLNAVSNAASSAAGKVSVSSSVFAATFHNAVLYHAKPASLNVNPLEHLLVYAPPGNAIQYVLLPTVAEHGESAIRTGTGSLVQMQDEDLRVKSEPVQWWDVCRRVDWLEKEEFIYGISSKRQETTMFMGTFDYEDNATGEKDTVKLQERSNWHLSNAEVHIQSGRMPVWQKSKICFFRMNLLENGEHNLSQDDICGEIEIENITLDEVEIKQKDLLPVFDRFYWIQSNWSDNRATIGGKHSTSSTSLWGKEKFSEDATISHAKLVSSCSHENPDVDSSRPPAPLRGLDQMCCLSSYPKILPTGNENYGVKEKNAILLSSPLNQVSFKGESCVIDNPASPKPGTLSTEENISREFQSSSSVVTSEVSNTSSNRSDLSMNILDEGPMHEDMQEPLELGQYFEEGYCKVTCHSGCPDLTEVTDGGSSNSPCRKEKSEEYGDDDDIHGGVFSFSEEG
ncbi:hypothetical protein NMG60_11020672 [Bertholletia excelsa]